MRYYITARSEDGTLYYAGRSWEYTRNRCVRKLRMAEAARLVASLREREGPHPSIHTGLFRIRMRRWP